MITISNNPATDQPADTRRIRQEIAIVLVVTFGLSGMRAALRLLSDLMQPVPLNQQQTTLAEHQSDTSWIDLAMQLCSSAMLFSWGFLALYLLRESIFSRWQPKAILEGAGLAALIGIPGLVFYLSAVHFGFSKQVVPSTLNDAWWEIIVLLIWSAANAFSEEIVVVMWLITRLQQLRIPPWVALLLSAAGQLPPVSGLVGRPGEHHHGAHIRRILFEDSPSLAAHSWAFSYRRGGVRGLLTLTRAFELPGTLTHPCYGILKE